jgi:hypothetical protein
MGQRVPLPDASRSSPFFLPRGADDMRYDSKSNAVALVTLASASEGNGETLTAFIESLDADEMGATLRSLSMLAAVVLVPAAAHLCIAHPSCSEALDAEGEPEANIAEFLHRLGVVTSHVIEERRHL